MIIGFDLDGTYAADKTTFHAVVELFKTAGHTCLLVTNRCEGDRAVVESFIEKQMLILFSCGRPKRKVAEEAGYHVAVWVDDNPILVDYGAEGLRMVGGAYSEGKLQ